MSLVDVAGISSLLVPKLLNKCVDRRRESLVKLAPFGLIDWAGADMPATWRLF